MQKPKKEIIMSLPICKTCQHNTESINDECIDCDIYWSESMSTEINITNYIPRGRQRDNEYKSKKGRRKEWLQ